ncbi:Ent-kaurene oxidase [Madurella mycetomatis]|uniref:Ent-kaurene oxidase n=1 Tax=Madurella mycetomatis TaxID=100816 RepID=A0A175W9G1_9PEZI|nr:Ent-kaurene oxidase [Madurella mycetomatis]
MTATLILIIAIAAVWLRAISAPKINATYFAFEGDNSANRYIAEAGSLLAQGYEKPFTMRNASDPKRPVAILPLRYLEEVRNAPQSKLSFPLFMEKTDHVLQSDGIIQPIQDEVTNAFNKEMPPCPGWTSINPYHLIAQSFARIATRVLVGPELCEGRWLTLSRDYINSANKAPGVVRHKYPPWLRWVAKYIEPSVHNGAELFRPVLEARIAELDNAPPQAAGRKERSASRLHEDAI